MTQIINGDAIEYFRNYKGDILIGHQVNCQGIMGAGIARQIAQEFPIVNDLYRHRCTARVEGELLGVSQMCYLEEYPGKFVVNLFGQDRYGTDKRYTNYAQLGKALITMRDLIEKPKSRIIFPYGMGCGLGGGNWSFVREIISDVFPDAYFLRLIDK